ncbi:hypothetical protein ICMP_514 [Candidatus Ishikawaella capsulata Mpkobe]|uniref:Uncharacterized protein n=2 Tax=Candidatus Ishikawella capsulata TaxID=168169 RepID=C5WDF5_9ENTR|nr:hypothetical protein ICMP_514 [Candidatus Ishikawaella capsulata Mpkobe]
MLQGFKETMKNQIEYQNYLRQMNKLFNVEVDEKRFSQLVEQFMYIAEIAEPLINFPLENYL